MIDKSRDVGTLQEAEQLRDDLKGLLSNGELQFTVEERECVSNLLDRTESIVASLECVYQLAYDAEGYFEGKSEVFKSVRQKFLSLT